MQKFVFVKFAADMSFPNFRISLDMSAARS